MNKRQTQHDSKLLLFGSPLIKIMTCYNMLLPTYLVSLYVFKYCDVEK